MVQIPLTPEQLTALAEKYKGEGIAISSNEGKITKMGVTASYVYKDGVLSVTILEKPFFVSTEFCEEQLKKALAP
jgi:hypothetical protein